MSTTINLKEFTPHIDSLRNQFDQLYKKAFETYPIHRTKDFSSLDQATPAALRELKKEFENWIVTTLEQVREIQSSSGARELIRFNKTANKSGLRIEISTPDEGYHLNEVLHDKTGFSFVHRVAFEAYVQYTAQEDEKIIDRVIKTTNKIASKRTNAFLPKASLDEFKVFVDNVIQDTKNLERASRYLPSEKILAVVPSKGRKDTLGAIRDSFDNIAEAFGQKRKDLVFAAMLAPLEELSAQTQPLPLKQLSPAAGKLLKSLLHHQLQMSYGKIEREHIEFDLNFDFFKEIVIDLRSFSELVEDIQQQKWKAIRTKVNFVDNDRLYLLFDQWIEADNIDISTQKNSNPTPKARKKP